MYAKLFQAFLSRPSICKMMLNSIGYIFRYCRIACDGIKKPVNEEPKRRLLSLRHHQMIAYRLAEDPLYHPVVIKDEQ